MSENEFPKLRDALSVLSDLIEAGYGELPFQIIVAPDSTLQALARHAGAKDDDKPALLITFDGGVSIVSTDRFMGSAWDSAPRTAVQ